MSDRATEDGQLREWLEFGYKVVTGIVLVAIPIVVKLGADDIAASLQTGQLVETLIEDLTTRDEATRQDIALIALDGAIGETKPEMVVQIAEQVMNSRPETAPEDTVAYRIIERRASDAEFDRIIGGLRQSNPEKANEVVANEVVRGPSSRSAPADEPQSQQTLTATPETSKIARAFESIIYIQFRPEQNRRLAARLQSVLRENGWLVPGIEHVDASYSNSIRYFHEDDRALAERVERVTRAFLADSGRTVAMPELRDFSRLTAPRGQIEVWIDFGESPADAGQRPPRQP